MLGAVLGGFALALATVGMFGVFAYAVRQRTRRSASAWRSARSRPRWFDWCSPDTRERSPAGLVAGLFGAVASSVVLRSRLHGLSPFDPVAYLGVAALPGRGGARRQLRAGTAAVRVDPVVALRYE